MCDTCLTSNLVYRSSVIFLVTQFSSSRHAAAFSCLGSASFGRRVSVSSSPWSDPEASDWDSSGSWSSDASTLNDGDDFPTEFTEDGSAGLDIISGWNAGSEDMLDQARDRNAKYLAMKERGMTEEQIQAFLGPTEGGDVVTELPEELSSPPAPPSPTTKVLISVDEFVAMTTGEAVSRTEGTGASAFGQMVAAPEYGEVSSHKLVELDETGEPTKARFVYVDEESCIGCTYCAGIAQSTFCMNDEYGRARVFNQAGDSEDIVLEAIDTCPVDCIHFVSWEELITQETVRDRDDREPINYKARLVGGDGASKAAPMLSGNSGMRCNNCPGNGCKVCPMFGVGENPMYIKKKMKVEHRKKLRSEKKSRDESIDVTEL